VFWCFIGVSVVSISWGGVSVSWSGMDGVMDGSMMDNWGSVMDNWGSVMDSVGNNWGSMDSMSYWSSMVNSVSSSVSDSTKVGESCEGHIWASCSQGNQSDQGKSLHDVDV